MCSACTLKGEKGFLSGQRRRENVVDPTRNNHRKWKHDVGHDIEAVSVLLSHDSTTASSAALLRRPSIPPIPGNLPPIPAATSPTTSFSTRCSLVISRNYNHSWTDFSLISIYIYVYPINRIYSNRLNDGRLIICIACCDCSVIIDGWPPSGWKMETGGNYYYHTTVFSFPSMFFEQMNDIESVVRGFSTKWGWYCLLIFPLFCSGQESKNYFGSHTCNGRN